MVRHRTCYTADMGSDVGRKRRVPYGVGARYRTDAQRGAALKASIGAYRGARGGLRGAAVWRGVQPDNCSRVTNRDTTQRHA